MAKAQSARKRKKSTRRATKPEASAKPRASRQMAKTRPGKKTGAQIARRTPAPQERAVTPAAAQVATAEPQPDAPSRDTRQPTPSIPDTPLTTAAAAVGAALGKTVEAMGRLPFRASDRDALKLLENDHRRLEALLRRGEETTNRGVAGRSRLLDTLTAELAVHEDLEEKLLYPALKAYAEAAESVLEGYQEHHVADVLLEELHALATDDERWAAKFKVLKENLEHHIEEEESQMFRIARSVLTREEREQLGQRMQAMRMNRR
jgi:hypothetical protein